MDRVATIFQNLLDLWKSRNTDMSGSQSLSLIYYVGLILSTSFKTVGFHIVTATTWTRIVVQLCLKLTTMECNDHSRGFPASDPGAWNYLFTASKLAKMTVEL